MRRALVTSALLVLLIVLAGCAGKSAPGGVPASSSVLLGVPLPEGTDYVADRSRIKDGEGLEILVARADAGLCAETIRDALRIQGWSPRLGGCTDDAAWYVFEKDGRLASVSVGPDAATKRTLVAIVTASKAPLGVPVPPKSEVPGQFYVGVGVGAGGGYSHDWPAPDVVQPATSDSLLTRALSSPEPKASEEIR